MSAIRSANDAIHAFFQDPLYAVLSVAEVVLLIESCHLALAFVLCSWGALADERLRDSYRNSLKQAWMRTPHALLIVPMIWFFSTNLEKAGNRWLAANPYIGIGTEPEWPESPELPSTDPGYAAAMNLYQQEMSDYQKAAAEYYKNEDHWRQSQPWYLRNEEPVSMLIGIAATLWWIAALFRALGVEQKVTILEESSRCLWCGYDLNMMPMESRCPECGKTVTDSLGEAAQPGAAWENRRSAGHVSTWWHTGRSEFCDVVAFGRTLQLRTHRTDHRRFLFSHLPIVFLIGAAGVMCAEVLGERVGPFPGDWVLTFLVATVFGTLCVIGTILVTCGTASLMGWLTSLGARRNLLPAAMQIAAYGATYLTAWAFFGALLINSALCLQIADLYQIAEDFTGIHRDALFFFSCFLPNLICGLVYLRLVACGTNGARYANR